MAEIKNFEQAKDFFSFNDSYIYHNYLPHYNLIKTIEHLRDKSLGLIDAFNIIGEDCFILCICTDSGWLIYSTKWTDNAIDKLYERIDFTRFKNWQFGGQRKLMVDLFEKYNVPYNIHKDRLVYECKSVTTAVNISPGNAVSSSLKDWERITELTHEYNIEEWGHREGRDIEYVRNTTLSSIQNQAQVHWEDVNGTICAIAQVMNLDNNFPFIGSLYTDKNKRNSGYATSLLYKVTDKLLSQGYKVCGLLSDVTNPSSNKIFKKVGYLPIYEFILLEKS